MLSVLCKLLSADGDEKKTQYFSKVFKRDMLNTSKGEIEETPLLCSMEFLIDLLTLTQAGIKKKCGPQYANMDYRPENVYYDTEADKLCIGKQYQPGDVLTFNGATGDVISGEPLQVLVGYNEGTTGKCLGYLISEYKDGNFVTSRVSEQELLEKIVVENISCCNAMVTVNEIGEQILERKNQGFVYTIDTSDITQLKKSENIDKEALALTEKTVKIKRDTKLGQMMNTASNNILNWLAADEIGVCSDDQKAFLAEYYSWYTKRTFEFLQGSSDIKMRASKIMALDSLHLSKDIEWRHIGYYTSPTRSFRCSDPSCGKALSKAHIFECKDPNVGNVKLMFGADCAEQFFDMTSDTLTCLADASTIVEAEIKNIFNIFRNNRVEEAWDEIGMFKDTIIELRANNELDNTYGEENSKWLSKFLDNNIPFPDSLLTTVVTGISRKSTEMKDDDRAARQERIHKEVNLVRAKALNTVSIGQTDEEFHAINYDFWRKKEPQYTEIIDYLPESKEYFEFILRYKMYGRPLTGEALDKFNTKHKTTLRRLKHYLNARKFNALELSQITELLKLELDISKGIEDCVKELREFSTDKDIAMAIIDKYREFLKGSTIIDMKSVGHYLYLVALVRPLLPEVDVTEGKRNLKESLLRRRIATSYKLRLLANNNSEYSFIRGLKNSIYYPNYYKTDYDSDGIGRKVDALEIQLADLKLVRDECDKYLNDILIPYLKDNVLEKAKEEKKRKEEQDDKFREAKRQLRNNYTVFDKRSEQNSYIFTKLAEMSGVRLDLLSSYNNEYYFSTSGKKILKIIFNSESVRNEYYDMYTLYSDGVMLQFLDINDFENVLDSKVINKTTYKYLDLPHWEALGYENDNDIGIAILDTDANKVMVNVCVDYLGQIKINNKYANYTPIFDDFEYEYKTQKSSRLKLDSGFRHKEELDESELELLGSLEWTKSHKMDGEFLYSVVDKNKKKQVYAGLTDSTGNYLRDIRGITTDVSSAISELSLDYTDISILKFTMDLEDMLNSYLGITKKVDLLVLLRTLMTQYPKVVSSKTHLNTAKEALEKAKTFGKLNSQYKSSVVQVICDIISYNNLDKNNYDLSDAPSSMINYTIFFDNDKDFANRVNKLMDAVTIGELELDYKSTNILKTISRSGKCSDRQKKYFDEIEEKYEKAIYDKLID